jgi:predicted ATP-grasp superfamily ATP-dependent carboligase
VRGGPDGDTYYQPWVRGSSYGAIYVASHGRAVLLGVTRQLLGCAWAGVGEFRYVGSIGPLAWDGSLRREFERLGSCLAAAFPLCGLFGVDTVVAGPDVWAIEVNPRYTASVEVLERAAGWRAIELHRHTCRGGGVPTDLPRATGPLHGKAVVYASADGTVEPEWYRHLEDLVSPAAGCALADLPPVGTHIRAGQPVLTVLALGRDVRAVHGRLRNLASRIRTHLAVSSAPARPANR